MSEEMDEEVCIMDERVAENNVRLELAVSINEPIEKILYNEPVIVKKNTVISDVVNLLIENDVSCVLIVENNKLEGIFTERDVVRKLVYGKHDFTKEVVGSFMTRNPETLSPSAPIAYALNKMAAGGYRHIPLVDEADKPIGYLSIKDIIEHLADYYSNEILNLPPEPDFEQTSRDGG